jgi:hypothetical protein
MKLVAAGFSLRFSAQSQAKACGYTTLLTQQAIKPAAANGYGS